MSSSSFYIFYRAFFLQYCDFKVFFFFFYKFHVFYFPVLPCDYLNRLVLFLGSQSQNQSRFVYSGPD